MAPPRRLLVELKRVNREIRVNLTTYKADLVTAIKNGTLEKYYDEKFCANDSEIMAQSFMTWFAVFLNTGLYTIDDIEKAAISKEETKAAFYEMRDAERDWDTFLTDEVDPLLNVRFSANPPQRIDLADDGDKLTNALGLRRSVWNTCRVSYMRTIVSRMLTGKADEEMPAYLTKSAKFLGRVGMQRLFLWYLSKSEDSIAVPDSHHDYHQMGGDIVVDKEGKIHYFHQSKDSDDRPTVDSILQAIPS